MLILLSIYGIGVLLVFLVMGIISLSYEDGLAMLGVAIAAMTAVIWPIVLVLPIWDGIKLCHQKLFNTL